MNGRLTTGLDPRSYEVAKTEEGSNHWSSTENSRNNGRNVNFSTGSTYAYKYYSRVAMAVAAFTFEA